MHTAIKKLTCVLAGVLTSGAVYADSLAHNMVAEDSPSLIGLAIASVPDYMGSDDNTGAILPIARYNFKGSDRYISLIGSELSVNLMNNASWRIGPVINYVTKRDDDIDDEKVKKMEELDGYAEYGVFVQYRSADSNNKRNRWNVGLTFLTNSEDGNEGKRVRLSGQMSRQMTPTLDLNLGAGVWYADDDWTDYHFGVNADNVGTSGLPMYTADGGVNQYYLSVGVTYYVNKQWSVVGGLRYARFTGDAADSPLVEGSGGFSGRGSEDQLTAGVGFTYMF